MALIFYTNPMSRGRMARWMLEETGAPYQTKIIEYGPPMKAPAYLAINPMGKVPALSHGGTVITETAAIIAYLADAFPQAGLAPAPGSVERGPYYRWLFFAAGPLEAAMTNSTLKVEIPPERAGMVSYGSLKLVLDTLEQALARGPYILGETFSAADILLASQIGFGLHFKRIEARPGLAEYAARLWARPAAQRAAAIDGALPLANG